MIELSNRANLTAGKSKHTSDLSRMRILCNRVFFPPFLDDHDVLVVIEGLGVFEMAL